MMTIRCILIQKVHSIRQNEHLGTIKNGYGRNSRHKEFTFVAKVKDEDGNEKLVAYPRCIMASAPKCSIENGVEEVSEIEVEISIFPDEHENGKYEAVVSALGSNAELANTWMTSFTSELVRK